LIEFVPPMVAREIHVRVQALHRIVRAQLLDQGFAIGACRVGNRSEILVEPWLIGRCRRGPRGLIVCRDHVPRVIHDHGLVALELHTVELVAIIARLVCDLDLRLIVTGFVNEETIEVCRRVFFPDGLRHRLGYPFFATFETRSFSGLSGLAKKSVIPALACTRPRDCHSSLQLLQPCPLRSNTHHRIPRDWSSGSRPARRMRRIPE
jgi:hypothetical protein